MPAGASPLDVGDAYAGRNVSTHTLRVFARGGSPARLEFHAAVYCEVYAGYVAAFFGAE